MIEPKQYHLEKYPHMRLMSWLLVGLVAGGAFSTGIAHAGVDKMAGSSPFSGRGVVQTKPYTAEELDELRALAETVRGFEEEALEHRKSTNKLIEQKYQQKKNVLFNYYEKLIVDLEDEQRNRRDSAIKKFEAFVEHYPTDKRYTPDSMFRLSELYFERSYDKYFQARQHYDKAMDSWGQTSDDPEPTEPEFHYEPTIAMMQRLIVEFPDYRLLDGAYYLLGYCLAEQGEEERAVDVYREMVAVRPESHFAAEVWTRIGEYYFAANELDDALQAYTNVLGHLESPFYDKALYKLAWTHYRLADPERSPQEFQNAVDTFVRLLEFNESTKAQGKERGRDLRNESIQYIAISFAEEG
ncbi:MAG: tetratricopeptide repeat protein [Myxococcota bacterium]